MWELESRKGPVYSNASILSPDGSLLAKVATKRAQWYLDRDLAGKVYSDPLTIQLKFEPKGSGNKGDFLLLSDKENICVVCGTEDNLTTHHIIPSVFRRNFPDHIKGRNPADIVILCVPCHVAYEVEADKLKLIMKDRYAVAEKSPSHITTKRINRAVGFAHALLEHLNVIPAARRNLMVRYIKTELDISKLTVKILREVAASPRKRLENSANEFGKAVMNEVEDLQGFCEEWRLHFVQHAKPNFMPVGWNIHRKVDRNEQ